MKRTMSHLASILLTALALAGAVLGFWWLPDASSELPGPVVVAQSTSAILEGSSA